MKETEIQRFKTLSHNSENKLIKGKKRIVNEMNEIGKE
jgi:hypothetical protein